MSKLQAFYTTRLPRMDAIIQHLNRQSPGGAGARGSGAARSGPDERMHTLKAPKGIRA